MSISAHFLRQHAFRVIGEHHDCNLRQNGEGTLQQIVISDSRMNADGASVSSRIICWLPERIRNLVVVGAPVTVVSEGSTPASASSDSRRSCSRSPPANPTHRDARAQSRQIHGNIGCAARFLVLQGSSHHRHRRLGRDALDFAPDVLIEHHIADDQGRNIAPAGLYEA